MWWFQNPAVNLFKFIECPNLDDGILPPVYDYDKQCNQSESEEVIVVKRKNEK